MPTDNIAPLVVGIEAQTQRKKLRYRYLFFISIAYSFIAGMEAQRAIQRFRKDGSDSDWLFGVVATLFFLCLSIVSILRLLRESGKGTNSSASTNQ